MPSSSLFLKAGTVLSALSSTALATKYKVDDVYQGSSFLNGFDFFSKDDPTHGFVNYLDQGTASNSGLVKSIGNDQYLGVDFTTPLTVASSSNPTGSTGRNSVRIETKKSYNKGLFVVDIKHMPGGICGTWPAFWSLGSGEWPKHGEIDIIEGVNQNAVNKMVLHTDTSCKTDGKGQSDPQNLYDCALDSASGTSGCDVNSVSTATYGTGFNSNGGGVYAMEWTSNSIKMWFFPRGNIPKSITADKPDTTEFGTPNANFEGACNMDERFIDHRFIFDTTFCGDWAGNVYGQSSCRQYSGLNGMDSCKKFVAENPTAFRNAYWQISYFKTYSKDTAVSSSSSSHSSTASSTHHSSSSSTVHSTSTHVSSSSSVHGSSLTSSTVVSSSHSTVVYPSGTSTSSSSDSHATSSSADNYPGTTSTVAYPGSVTDSYPDSSSTADYSHETSSAGYDDYSSSTLADYDGYLSSTAADYDNYPSSTPADYDNYPSSTPAEYDSYPSSTSAEYDSYPSSTPVDYDSYSSSTPTDYDSYPSSTPVDYDSYPTSTSIEYDNYPSSTPADYDNYPSSTPAGYEGPSSTPCTTSSAADYYKPSSSAVAYDSSSTPSYDDYESSTANYQYYPSSSTDSYDDYKSSSVEYPVYPTSSADSYDVPSSETLAYPNTKPVVYHSSADSYGHSTTLTTTYTTHYVDVCSTGYTTIYTTATVTYWPETTAAASTPGAHVPPPGFTVTEKYCAKGCGDHPTTVTVTVPITEYVAKTIETGSPYESTPTAEKPHGGNDYEHYEDKSLTPYPTPSVPASVYETKVVTLSVVPMPESEYYGEHFTASSGAPYPPAQPSGKQGEEAYPYPSVPAGAEYTTPASGHYTVPGTNITFSYGTATGKQGATQTRYDVPEFTGGAASVKIGGAMAGAFAAIVVLFL